MRAADSVVAVKTPRFAHHEGLSSDTGPGGHCKRNPQAVIVGTMNTQETNAAPIEAVSAPDEIDDILATREGIWPEADPRWSALGARIILRHEN